MALKTTKFVKQFYEYKNAGLNPTMADQSAPASIARNAKTAEGKVQVSQVQIHC
jgi:hypothetical protein